MMLLPVLLEAINARKHKALQLAEVGLSESQFRAFRKLFLNEFGHRGLESDLAGIVAEYERLERKGIGQADTCRKGGAP